jgi:hypothetical protein
MKTTFKSTGLVLGNLWGGGTGAYRSIELSSDTREELIKQATNALNDGSLDSGMGYESLIGAILLVETIKTVEVDGEEFTRSEFETEYIGNLTEEQQDFLFDNL